jgi:hypothetical protein
MSSNCEECQVCHKRCHPLRCTKCGNAWYCSVVCQKIDWKSGHRKSCHSDTKSHAKANVNSALCELQALSQSLSVTQAKENYHRAQDEVERKINQKELDSEKTRVDLKSSPRQAAADSANTDSQYQPSEIIHQPIEKLSKTLKSRNEYRFSFMVENMQHISRFQITLKPKPNTVLSPTDLFVNTQPTTQSSSLVTLRTKNNPKALFYLELPRRLESDDRSSIIIEEDGTIQICLNYAGGDLYEHDLGAPIIHENQPDAGTINQLQCRFCDQSLLSKKPVDRVLPLPSGHWEEIADYLICYSGVSTSTAGVTHTGMPSCVDFFMHTQCGALSHLFHAYPYNTATSD